MDRRSKSYENCLHILREELIPAMGCTEPVAFAYAAALAKDLLGKQPERVWVTASGNLIKNVKSVTVPNTGGLKGIPAAVAAGIIAGKTEKRLTVIEEVTPRQKAEIREFLEQVPIDVELGESGRILDLRIVVSCGGDSAEVRIADQHTNVVYQRKNRMVLQEAPLNDLSQSDEPNGRSDLNLQTICQFADSVAIADVKNLLDQQIAYNLAIAEEGLRGDYGANIGRVIQSRNEDSLRNHCVSMAAAGSDARMNGCEMPVVINSGSGNQGIAASVPVIVYANGIQAPMEKLYRALVLSNLTAIYQKTGIGRLSAYCGAVNAGAAGVCGIAYLEGGDYRCIAHTLVNSLAICSGMICDGAKSSCAGKIAAAVEMGFLGYEMFQHGQQFRDGEGIVKKGADNTVSNVGRLGRVGMRQTDIEILHMMIGQ